MTTAQQTLKAIVFDLDGTIVDTESTCIAIVKECFERWGLGLAPFDARFIIGRRFEDSFAYLRTKYKIPFSDKRAKDEIFSAYESALKTSLVQAPGIIETLMDFTGKFQISLVSGSRRREIEIILNQMGILSQFDFYLGAEDYARGKPAPDGYIDAISRMGVEPHETLIFEDSEAGITSALDSGAWVSAVTWTETADGDPSRAHFSINDFIGVDSVAIIERVALLGPIPRPRSPGFSGKV